MPIKWSPYQEAVFDEVENGRGHVLVTARAGCAKTTTIVRAANNLDADRSILMTAFNKEIAMELDRKVLGHVKVSTLHGLGLRTLQKAWSAVGRLEPSAAREREVMRKVVPDLVGPDAKADVLQLVRMAKQYVVESDDALLDLMGRYDCAPAVDADKWVPLYLRWAREALAEFRKPSPQITFDDMIYVPAYLGLTTGYNHFVFVDETQDLNPAQLILAERAVRRGGRLVFVGDDRQAIYVFRGADANSIPNIRRRFAPKELKLTVTYRCPRKIVELARRYVPDFEAAPEAPDGVVERVTDAQMKRRWRPGDFVIARVNAVLVALCMEALSAGVPAYVVGRDIGAGLMKLIQRFSPDSVEDLVKKVRAWQQAELAKLVAAEEDDAKISAVTDKANTIVALCEGRNSIGELLAFVRRLFAEPEKDAEAPARLAFMTGHKAKGLENPRVWLIDSTFKPGRSREEENLYYVAMTRAQEELYLVTMPKKVAAKQAEPTASPFAEG